MERHSLLQSEKNTIESLQIPFAVYQFVDKRVVTLALSEGFCAMFGYSDRAKAYDDMDHNMYRDTHPDDVARIADAAFQFATNGGSFNVIYRTRDVSGSGYKVVHAMGWHTYTPEGVRLAHVSYTDEGSYVEGASLDQQSLVRPMNRALHQESLFKANYYDYLTGLPSMTYFFELAAAGRKAMLKRGEKPVLLFIDLSGMKFYNRKHGFAQGDKLLREVSQVLASRFSAESCCRMGQDHFAVFTHEAGLEDKLHQVIQQCQSLQEGNTLPLRIGIYPDQMEAVDISTACDRAKFACDSIRNTYASGFNYYDHNLRDRLEQRQYILANLDQAIAKHWIQVYYQPIIRSVNGRVCDEEALCRWIDPVKGFLSPGDFIPILEDAGTIYKLDLFVLDEVLKKLKLQANAGLFMVPQSINLSRSDFDACDIVEEIRSRVDSAGLPREMITIEITESIVGGDFAFMKAQIGKFRALGFPVWMDDFGSGYSSLEVLQSIQFDLIKLDMGFMKRFHEGEKNRIILTELVKMATSLGIDTVCEGVETPEQVRFLQEIGCSKLQGFHFTPPIPLNKVFERYKKGIQIGFENPQESDYYEQIGRVNLYDLSVVTNESEGAFSRFFNTIPMAIVEVQDGKCRFLRSNHSYREFVYRFFDHDMTQEDNDFTDQLFGSKSSFMAMVNRCCDNGKRTFFDEKMADGSTIHSFIRRIGYNPVTGTTAVAIAVLSVRDSDEGLTYAGIARALASDFYNIYYVDLDTERYIEYISPHEGGTLTADDMAMERQGEDFFAFTRQQAQLQVCDADRDAFCNALTRENLTRVLDENSSFHFSYRHMEGDRLAYMDVKAIRVPTDQRHIIIAISNVDDMVKQREAFDRIRQEQIAYSRIAALSGDYLCLYFVDPESEQYTEHNSTSTYKDLGISNQGHDFFQTAQQNGKSVIWPGDLPFYQTEFVKDRVLSAIARQGAFEMHYHLLLEDTPTPVVLRAVLVTEGDKQLLVMGISLDKAGDGTAILPGTQEKSL